MIEGILSECIGGGILLLMLFVGRKCWPVAQHCLSALWRRWHPRLSAGYAAAKAAPLWRKAFAALATAWIAGSFGAYALTGGDVSAPLWAQSWFGSVVGVSMVGCAVWQGWLAVRLAVRHTRRLMA